MSNFLKNKADFLGIFVAISCAVHCSILPLVIAFGVFQFGDSFDNLWVEAVFVGTSLTIAILSLLYSYKNVHNNRRPIYIAILGFAVFGIGIATHSVGHILFTTLGGVIIAASHFINYKLSHAV